MLDVDEIKGLTMSKASLKKKKNKLNKYEGCYFFTFLGSTYGSITSLQAPRHTVIPR